MKYFAGYIKDSKFYKIVAGLPLPFFFLSKEQQILFAYYWYYLEVVWKMNWRDKATRVEPNIKGRMGD